jgi:hypothetical protein
MPANPCPLDTVLQQLAECDDDLVRNWARKLLERGERGEGRGQERPAAADRPAVKTGGRPAPRRIGRT